jgi:hypothetical protein
VSEFENVNPELVANLIAALVNKLGGTVCIRPHDLLPADIQTRITQLPTGTYVLELVQLAAPTSGDAPEQSTVDADALMHLGG